MRKNSLKILAIVISTYFSTQTIFANQNIYEQQGKNEDISAEVLKSFIDAYQIIKNNYVDRVDNEKLIFDAMKGMVGNLDPHSQYLDKEDKDFLINNINGEFAGIGIEYQKVDKGIKVISPLEGTPADKAGIKSGDFIFKINDRSINTFKSVEEALKLLKGKAGEEVTLSALRDNKEIKFNLIKEIIKVQSTKSKIISNDFGYIRISAFQKDTSIEVHKALSEMLKERKIEGLILDLRGNPGGLLDEAIKVSDLFLDEVVVVFTKDRTNKSKLYRAKYGQIIKGIPIVVLVNNGSASASEIVAGALQDNKRAIIIGSKTFGKGSVQTIIEFDDGNAMKLTTSRYYTPNGDSIQAKGIIPDIEIDDLTVKLKKPMKRVSEKDLAGHITNDNNIEKDSSLNNIDPEKDYYLYEAVNTLKIIKLSRK